MPAASNDPIDLFDESFPLAVQVDMLRALRSLYLSSYRDTNGIVQTDAVRDLYPVVRRAQIEGGIRRVAERHGLSAEVRTNKSGNTHSVIHGGRFFLTVSAVGEPSALIRPAVFREAGALRNQPLFANLPDEDPPPDDAKYYAILKHGPARSSPDQLGHASIVFPSPSGRSCLDVSINLMTRFPEEKSTSEPFSEEIIPDLIEPRIRTDLPRECGDDV